MATGAIKPGGLKTPAPGGLNESGPGGLDTNNWRITQGHTNVEPGSPLVSSGARVATTRRVTNVRRDARTTNVTYAWTVPTVPGGSTTAAGSVTGGSTAQATFTPDAAGAYVFRCTVTFVKAAGNTTQVINFNYTSA